MSYFPLGDISADNFNATKYPGIVKPSNVTTLAVFKGLQSQLNRCAYVLKQKTIAIDGDVGPGTIALWTNVRTKVMATVGSELSGAEAAKLNAASSTVALANVADIAERACRMFADQNGAPATPPAPPPAKPPTLVMPSGVETPAPAGAGLLAAFQTASTPMKLAALGIAGGIGYYMLKGGKRRRR